MAKQIFTLVLCTLVTAAIVRAQPKAPATVPATAPATAPAPHRITMPPGFIKVEGSDRTALCDPSDKAWITKALTDLQTSSRPTTMPSDLADMLRTKRDDIIKQIVADTGLTDTAAIKKLLTENVVPDLDKMSDIRPPMFYMVCTKPKLMDLIHAGWSDPRFHYNRVADDIAVYQNIDLSIQHSMDDLLIPAIYDAALDVPNRITQLQKQIDQNEANIAASLSMQGQIMLQTGLVAALDDNVVKPLALKPGQEWFGIGVEGMLSTRYMSQLNGMRYEDLLKILTADDPRNPIRAVTINLLHPIAPNQLRPDYAPAYIDALRRRSVLVVYNLSIRTGPTGLPKLLAAIKKAPPKDGEGLLALIKQTVGVDLAKDVLPQN